jgi:transposase
MRDWANGFDLQTSINGHRQHEEERVEAVATPAPAAEAAPPPPQVVNGTNGVHEEAPPPEPKPDPVYVNGRHPQRDEAVAALRSGMMAAEVIEALELSVGVDALWDWDAEDRANKREIPKYQRRGDAAEPAKRKPGGGRNGRGQYSIEERKHWAKKWADGGNIKEVADEAGCSGSAVQLWAKLFGFERKPEFRNRRPEHPKKAEALRLYVEGFPPAEIARRTGLGTSTLANWINVYRAEHPELKRRSLRTAIEAAEATHSTPAPAPEPAAPASSPELLRAQQEAADALVAETERRIAAERKAVADAAALAAAQFAAAPRPVPMPLHAPAPRKLLVVTKYACWSCQGEIVLPSQAPGMLRVRQAECPHCSAVIDI